MADRGWRIAHRDPRPATRDARCADPRCAMRDPRCAIRDPRPPVDNPLGPRYPPGVRDSSRREFLAVAGMAGAGLLVPGGRWRQPAPDGWASVDDILRRIVPPVF